jgi:hypothetical protein
MERERALIIRTWRVELGASWRKVAELAAKVWPKEFEDSGQMLGHDLCIKAADTLEEDPSVEPWN